MNALKYYIEQFVEPTFEDFKRNPASERHAFLACVTAYHAVDRATYPKRPRNLKSRWRKECRQFAIVDMMAHHFKHVVSDDEKAPHKEGTIPLASSVFGYGTFNTAPFNTMAYNEVGIDLRNISYLIQEVITFLKKQAEAQ
ncbi:hypothetical protein ABIB06_007360 [Bradyrhizobium sp. LB8.2]|uniref:hypothetical protein n=1 Tax=unclassified Bradyrhizobium TaxID=2631580 RepID=UPI003390CBE2